MNRYKINNVTRLAPVGGGCLVGCDVHGVQHIAEEFISLCGKKRKALSWTLDFSWKKIMTGKRESEIEGLGERMRLE